MGRITEISINTESLPARLDRIERKLDMLLSPDAVIIANAEPVPTPPGPPPVLFDAIAKGLEQYRARWGRVPESVAFHPDLWPEAPGELCRILGLDVQFDLTRGLDVVLRGEAGAMAFPVPAQPDAAARRLHQLEPRPAPPANAGMPGR